MQLQIPLVSTTSEGDITGRERLVNVYPRVSTGGKYSFHLIGSPGLAEFISLPTFPVIGLHENGERAFAVTPSKFYEIFPNGTYKELGDIDLKGRPVIADNGIQVVVVDGLKGFYYDINTDEVKQITDSAFYPAKTVTYQDGYFIFERKDTAQWFISKLLSADFNGTDFATAEGQPDKLVGVLSDHRELYLFGSRTTEIWFNAGAANFPFRRSQGAFIEKGCAAPYTIRKHNNTVFFVGSDLIVYALNGYSPMRVSNNAVEATLKDTDLSDAFAYTYQDEGQLFYVLTIPTVNITWCYDVTTGSWHQKKSKVFGRHYSDCCIYFDSKTLVGDFQNGKIYEMANYYYSDDEYPIIREFILPTVNNGRDFMSIYSFELDMSSGIGRSIVSDGIGIDYQGEDPIAILNFSKDNGKNWSNDKFTKLGKIGEYLTRVKWNRLGCSRQFDFKITISDPVPIDIGGAYIEV